MADQRRSENRVSWSEVASPCCFSLPFGPVLPSCVRVTSAVEKKWLTEWRRVKYAHKQEKMGLFSNVTTVLPTSGREGHPTDTFLRSVGRPLCPSRTLKRSKLQDRRIIPAKGSSAHFQQQERRCGMKRPCLPPAPDPRRSGLFIRLLQRQENGRRQVVRGWIGGKAYHFFDKSKLVLFLCITLSVALTTEAHAYLDPGIGTYTF